MFDPAFISLPLAIIEDTTQAIMRWFLYISSFYNNLSCYDFRLKILEMKKF